MSGIVANEYAHLLKGEDIIHLFGLLEESTSRAEAARLCGIERKTVYNWKLVKNLRVSTKKKILKALLEWNVDITYDYLIKKGIKISSDLSMDYLSELYQSAMKENINYDNFNDFYNQFINIRIKFSSILNHSFSDEIIDMLNIINEKAILLGVEIIPIPISGYSGDEILSLIDPLMKKIPIDANINELKTISEQLMIPLDFINKLHDVKITAVVEKMDYDLIGGYNNDFIPSLILKADESYNGDFTYRLPIVQIQTLDDVQPSLRESWNN